jgi:hypothetical protein
MARYHFVTDIRLLAAPDPVWRVLVQPVDWPRWWPRLAQVELRDPGRPDGLGRRYRLAFRTALPYTLSFESETVRIRAPSLWEARVHGELDGTGVYELFAEDGATCLRHTWIVATTKPWMNLLAPLARPAFAWNHAVLMRDFATGLAGRLGVPLISAQQWRIEPGAPGFGELAPSPVP